MMFSSSFIYLSILLTCFLQDLRINAANWAQASGKLEQNIAIPYIPSPSNPHWTPRYGSSSVHVESSVDTNGYVLLMGGDSYFGSTGSVQSLFGAVDLNWYNGYKNDVWKMNSVGWTAKGDIRLRTYYKSKLPQLTSTMKWIQETAGLLPPPRISYDEWIICEEYFNQPKYEPLRKLVCDPAIPRHVQWSPRRHHASVVFKGEVYVLGGRAREIVEFSEERSIGGILSPRILDPDSPNVKFTTQREASIPKNDVWKSVGGANWTLVTPGCKQPQMSLVSIQAYHIGTSSAVCRTDEDCYGAEICMQETCVCQMWTAREQLAAVADDDYIYIAGGYASQLYSHLSACGQYACGDTDASGYRYILSDIWRSSDGMTWELVIDGIFPPRAGHQMTIFPDRFQNPTLWIFGGRGGDNIGKGTTVYFSDTWFVSISEMSNIQSWNRVDNNWEPRYGHTCVYEPPSYHNANIRRVYILGGELNNGLTVDDVWIWRPDHDPQGLWTKDFTSKALYSIGYNTTLTYLNDTPTVNYVYPNGNVSLLERFFVPDRFKTTQGQKLQTRSYMTTEKIAMLNSVGIYTISDLANAGLYTILKLRGFDYPAVSQRLTFTDICDVRALAIAIVEKCSVDSSRVVYDGQQQMPWNVIPEFGGSIPNKQLVAWHGRSNYNFLGKSIDDEATLLSQWDGCTYVSQIEDVYGVNVPGIGFVSQVSSIEDPYPLLRELVCKQTPGARMHHNSLYHEGRVYTFGGKASSDLFYADTWYRDDNLPIATFNRLPSSRSSDHIFDFKSANNEPVYFEYRVWEPYKYRELRPWTQVTRKADVSWLNWREGGPSNGDYTLYVRAIDPAGNKDAFYYQSSTGNVYSWHYLSPTPWDIILIVICSIIGLVLLGYLEYRRRIRKAAIERYAMKRLRRKFKALQRDEEEGGGRFFDWRMLYFESKFDDPLRKKQSKQQKRVIKDKRKERREKLRKRRQLEKERIKLSLDGNKNHVNTRQEIQIGESQALVPLLDGNQTSQQSNAIVLINNQNRFIYDEDEEMEIIENKNQHRYRPFQILSKPLSIESNRPENRYAITNPNSDKDFNDWYQVFDDEGNNNESGLKQSNLNDLYPTDEYSLYPTTTDIELEAKSGSKQRKINRKYHDYEEDSKND